MWISIKWNEKQNYDWLRWNSHWINCLVWFYGNRKAWSARQENIGRRFSVFHIRIGASGHDVIEEGKHLSVVLSFQLEILAAATRRQRDRNTLRMQMAQQSLRS